MNEANHWIRKNRNIETKQNLIECKWFFLDTYRFGAECVVATVIAANVYMCAYEIYACMIYVCVCGVFLYEYTYTI